MSDDLEQIFRHFEKIIRHFNLIIHEKVWRSLSDNMSDHVISNKSSDILQNHQQYLINRWLFMNAVTLPQQAHDVIITSLLRQNVIIASHVHWDCTHQEHMPCVHQSNTIEVSSATVDKVTCCQKSFIRKTP